jgi:hypothetical protein
VTNPRHVLIVPREFAEIVAHTVIETLQPTESQLCDFMNTFIDRLHDREDALN